MPKLAEWSPNDPVQLLVYGKSKVGKTWGALTAPRPVVFDFDGGIATGRNPDFVKKYGMRDVFYETFAETKVNKGVVTQHNAFDDACRYFDEWMKPDGKWTDRATGEVYKVGRDQFDTFVVDSCTILSELAQNKAVIITGQMKLSHSHEVGMKLGLVVPKIQDYGAERSLVEQFIDMVMGSGKNIIVLCHEKEITDDNGNITSIVPLLTGKSAERIPLKFDEVYNLRAVRKGPEVVRSLQTAADGLRKVGTRYGIPDGSSWDWDTIKGTLDAIKVAQRAQVVQPTKE